MVNGDDGGDEYVHVCDQLSWERSRTLSCIPSSLAKSVLTLERSLDLKKAVLLALLNLQSQDACYRSQQKHSTHRPSNQWGAAGPPGRDWLIKEKENKQQGKGRA